MDRISPLQIFLVFLRLGLTSFGGPVAHLGYFHRALIQDRRWLGEERYAELIGLCQFLPGPTSSQVGLGIGLAKGGWPGAVAAWLGFTLPSAVIMTAVGLSGHYMGRAVPHWLVHGLILVAVPIVAQAVWIMARQLCPDWPRRALAMAAALLLLTFSAPIAQPLIILTGSIVGALAFAERGIRSADLPSPRLLPRLSPFLVGLFFLFLFVLPPASKAIGNHTLSVFSAFYWSGALVFGGGHVVLPLLQTAVVPTGWITPADFLAGYGAAQAMPGPLFSFAAYLGAAMTTPPTGFAGAVLCLVAIYVPSFLLVIGALPIWQIIRHRPRIRGAVVGINAVVVGLLAATLYRPVWISAITTPADIAIVMAGLVLLVRFRCSSWGVVLFTISAAGIISI